jgi:hypothetical protein
MNFLYTSILGAIFAILAIAYIYFRTTYSREVIHKEKFIEYKYRQYKYVLIAFIIFLSLTYFVFKIEDSNAKRKQNVKILKDLTCILEKIKYYYNNPDNKVAAISSYNDLINSMQKDGKLDENQVKFIDKFYYIHSNVYKPLRSLLESNKYDILLENLEEHIRKQDSSTAKDVLESGACLAKNIASAGIPSIAITNTLNDIYRKDNKALFS